MGGPTSEPPRLQSIPHPPAPYTRPQFSKLSLICMSGSRTSIHSSLGGACDSQERETKVRVEAAPRAKCMKPHEKCMIPPGLLSRLAYLLQEVHDTSRFIIREVSVIIVWVVGVTALDMWGGGGSAGAVLGCSQGGGRHPCKAGADPAPGGHCCPSASPPGSHVSGHYVHILVILQFLRVAGQQPAEGLRSGGNGAAARSRRQLAAPCSSAAARHIPALHSIISPGDWPLEPGLAGRVHQRHDLPVLQGRKRRGSVARRQGTGHRTVPPS